MGASARKNGRGLAFRMPLEAIGMPCKDNRYPDRRLIPGLVGMDMRAAGPAQRIYGRLLTIVAWSPAPLETVFPFSWLSWMLTLAACGPTKTAVPGNAPLMTSG